MIKISLSIMYRTIEIRDKLREEEMMFHHQTPLLRGPFEKFPDWFYYKTKRSAAVFLLLPMRSSYSSLSMDIISSVE
jgi:hypothetical protein